MKMTLKQQLTVMASIAFISVLALGSVSYLLAKNTTIGSRQSQIINDAETLRADILPPPMFLVEALLNLQKLTSASPTERPLLAKKIRQHFVDYQDRANVWATNTNLPPDIIRFVDKQLNPSAYAFIDKATKEILPAALNGDEYELRQSLAALIDLYEQHHAAVDKLVEMANQFSADEHARSVALVSTYQSLLYAVAIIAIAAVFAASYFFSLRILTSLGADPAELQRVASAVASGDLDIRLPPVTNKRSVLGATAAMLESLKENLAHAAENLRIRTALDATSTNVMIADAERTIIYMNNSAAHLMKMLEPELKPIIPQFSASRIIGNSMDHFHRAPDQDKRVIDALKGTHVTTLNIGKHTIRVIASPIVDSDGSRLGTVVEWLDRTQEVAAEKDIADLVYKATHGDFKARIDTTGKEAFFLHAAEGLNSLVSTAEKGLADVSRVLGALATGDLTATIDADYAGTFGELKNYCNETTRNLTTMLSEIRSAAGTILRASSEIAAGNADLSNRTEQQAANLEETASSMEEITSTVKLNADNAKQANNLTENATMIAAEGGTLIQQVVATMNDINESSRKIADIIGVIDSIAFQTNILALNAAVEAARAGDQGRGFAVVAAEVRTLAQRSANAAKDIKSLISASVKKIESGNELVERSGHTVKDTVVAIKRVNDIMAEIAAASSEQSASIQNISQTVVHMEETTQKNAALVEQAAAAAESLQSQADQLAQRVAQFRFADDSAVALPASQPRAAAKPALLVGSGAAAVSRKPQDDEWESF